MDAAIFHNFYCDNTYLYFPSLSVGTEELLARVVEQYQSEYGSTESRARLEQSLRWSGADLAEYLFDGGAATVFDIASEGLGSLRGVLQRYHEIGRELAHGQNDSLIKELNELQNQSAKRLAVRRAGQPDHRRAGTA